MRISDWSSDVCSSDMLVSTATATCSAVGKLSFDDWPMLTWSLGWTGDLPPRVPASFSFAIPAITSFAFMFDWVPLPVCQIAGGDRTSAGEGKRGSVRVDFGGRGIIKKKTKKQK